MGPDYHICIVKEMRPIEGYRIWAFVFYHNEPNRGLLYLGICTR